MTQVSWAIAAVPCPECKAPKGFPCPKRDGIDATCWLRVEAAQRVTDDPRARM